uniref:Uncharacterized protein n=1 Tax=Eutreptiella gymnastica TaxID=73025 RepID=A0A7S1NBB1_9EUGL|mmetsp:Transcript_148973/g.260327  ORF Transcript_148973/g.260327 Transcript_148973/m.260327 type:complete len:577 (+) Transcript_148973:119-1849(+)
MVGIRIRPKGSETPFSIADNLYGLGPAMSTQAKEVFDPISHMNKAIKLAQPEGLTLKGSATKDTPKALHRQKHTEGALAFINLGHAYGLDHVERCRRRAQTSPGFYLSHSAFPGAKNREAAAQELGFSNSPRPQLHPNSDPMPNAMGSAYSTFGKSQTYRSLGGTVQGISNMAAGSPTHRSRDGTARPMSSTPRYMLHTLKSDRTRPNSARPSTARTITSAKSSSRSRAMGTQVSAQSTSRRSPLVARQPTPRDMELPEDTMKELDLFEVRLTARDYADGSGPRPPSASEQGARRNMKTQHRASPTARSEELVELAKRSAKACDYDQAKDQLTLAIDLKPMAETLAAAHHLRAILYHRNLGDYPAARDDYTKSIANDPFSAQVYRDRADLFHYAMELLHEAMDDYNSALELGSHDAEVYFSRGELRSQLNHPDGALEDFQAAATMDPNHIGVRQALVAQTAQCAQLQKAKAVNALVQLLPVVGFPKFKVKRQGQVQELHRDTSALDALVDLLQAFPLVRLHVTAIALGPHKVGAAMQRVQCCQQYFQAKGVAPERIEGATRQERGTHETFALDIIV